MMRASALFSIGALGIAACAILDEPAQCAMDDDCAGFGAVCDTAQAICVPRGTLEPTGSDASPGTSDAATTPDATTTPLPSACNVSPKPTGNPTAGLAPSADGGGGRVAGSLTLGCEMDWILEGQLVVPSGATLTLQAGTKVLAKKNAGAMIVVEGGGRIVAEGQRDAPVVLTVDDPAPAAGSWNGLFINGAAANDDSGVLSFVRIEYAQSGIMFQNVGQKTKVDSIQVRHSNDACFTFFGGNVDAKHLVCQVAADEQFEFGQGYKGRLQFLYGQRSGVAGGNHNGILSANPGTSPTIYNATICGLATPPTVANYGLFWRDGAGFDANNVILSGWYGTLEATGALGNAQLRASRSFNNGPNVDGDGGDDDNGFDEMGFFRDGGNSEANPNIVDCYNQGAPKPWPNAMIGGARKPPADGFFDEAAQYIGAFKGENDGWMKGAWVKFAPN